MSYFDDHEEEIIHGPSFKDLEDDFYSGQWKYVQDATPERRAHAAQFGIPSMSITAEEFMRQLHNQALWEQSGSQWPPEFGEDDDFFESWIQPPTRNTSTELIKNPRPTYINGEWVTPLPADGEQGHKLLDIPETIHPSEVRRSGLDDYEQHIS